MNNQLFLFFLSVVFGFVISFFYDFLVIFRKIAKHFNFIIQVEDFIYWVVSALLLFFIMLKENHGEIRGFLILGCFVGMTLYFTIISKLFLKVSDKILSALKKAFIIIFKIIYAPLEAVCKLFKALFLLTFGKMFFKKTHEKK